MTQVLQIFILLFLMTAAQNSGDYCETEDRTCGQDGSDQKYLFYDVNPPEGFNLRRDVYMRFAIMLAEAHNRSTKNNWRLVLPPWNNLYHWRTESSRHSPIPWGLFFDMNALKSFAPVVELHEIFEKTEGNKLKIDRVYVLQNFADAFENGVFTDKWEMSSGCTYNAFWGFKNVTAKAIECVNFQGKISKLWEVMSLHPSDRYIMFAHGEIPLHDTYGTKTFWDCRRSMKFNDNLIARAETFISKYLNCDTKMCNNYVSVHWRRQDFARYRKNDVPSIKGTAKQINQHIKQFNSYINNVFIASDADITSLRQLELELTQMGYVVHYYIPSKADIDQYKEGGVAIIDQIICSHAAYFIGTHESTFTFRIQEEREILGQESKTTFNRLCPDSGRCEKPSKWTIVH